MPVSRILSRLAFCTGLSRKSHRRRFARSFSPGLVRLEQLEQKVLLSATTIDDATADDIVDAMESPSVDQSANYDDYADSYSDVDYYETVLSSPVGEDYGDYADEYYAQETAALDAVAESYEAGATDTQPHMPNSTADEDADDEDTINDDLVNDTTERLDEVVPGADRDADDDEGDQAPAEPTPSPFEFPAEVINAFEPLTPPIQETSDNLFLVQPDGTESFETVITTQSAVTADATDDEHAPQSLPTTDLEREVTLQQTWNDTDDWTIHQSVTNRFDRESKTTDEEGDDQNNGRSGSETLSVTVINGTTTVTSWSISNTQTFRTGTIPGQQDDDTFAIPEEWITAAATSVNKEDEEVADDDPLDKPPGDKNVADEGQTAVPQQEDESGSSIRTTNDLSVTTTQTLITLPGGAHGMTITSTVGWSASFTWKDGGSFSSDESDLPEDIPDELSGMTLNSSFRYNAYVTASIATSFTVTATVPLLSDGVPDLTDAEFEPAFGFAVSGMAGGSSKATTKADLETRTGDEADDTDERLIVRVDDQQAASGSMGFSFYIISGSEELSNQSTDDGPAPSAVQYSPDETAGEANNPTDPKTDKDEDATDGGGDSPDGTGRDSNDDRPRAGSESAGELLAGEAPGVQFTLDASSSSSDTKSHTFEEKIRSATADYRTFTETTLTETTETTSDRGLGVAVGTQENSFRISSSGSDSEEVNSSLTWWQDGYDSSNDPHGDDDGYGSEVWEVSTFDGTSESDYDFEISIGGSSGATFTNDSSFFVEWTETEKISDIPEETGEESGYLTTTAYRNGSAGDIERIDRRSTEFFSPDGNFEFIENDQVPAVPEPDPPRTQDAILSDYQSHAEQLARLNALLAGASDPALQQYYQDEITIQQNILDDLTTEATNTGVDRATLQGIDDEAAANVADNPPSSQDAEPPGHAMEGNLLYEYVRSVQAAIDDDPSVLVNPTSGSNLGSVIVGSLVLSIPSFFRGLSESGDTLEDEIDESDGGKKALLSTVGRAYHWVAVTWSMLPVEMAAAGLLGRFFVAPNRGGWKSAANAADELADAPFAPGSVGAARVWSSIKSRLKAAQLPTSGKIRFVPPKNYNPASPLRRGPKNGYLDRFGNEWTRGPSRTAGEAFEWDVQLSNRGREMLGWLSREGNHVNVSLGGHVTH